MSASATPGHLHDRLPADAYYHLVRTLCLTLPPPLTDDPDDLTRRNHAAVARVAAFAPANAAEADFAAQVVAATEQWKDCLRLVQVPETTPETALKCRAQAIGMMRQATSALRLLLRLQAARQKRDADSTACNSAAWTEHCAIALMAEALAPAARSEAPAPCADAGVAKQPTPPPQPAPLEPRSAPAPVAEPEPEPLDAAEEYAILYPERAAQIRRLGRLPANASFGPPHPKLLQALITARTPALAALDREYAQASAA